MANTADQGIALIGCYGQHNTAGAWSAVTEKNTTPVDIPDEIDMAPYVVGPQVLWAGRGE